MRKAKIVIGLCGCRLLIAGAKRHILEGDLLRAFEAVIGVILTVIPFRRVRADLPDGLARIFCICADKGQIFLDGIFRMAQRAFVVAAYFIKRVYALTQLDGVSALGCFHSLTQILIDLACALICYSMRVGSTANAVMGSMLNSMITHSKAAKIRFFISFSS